VVVQRIPAPELMLFFDNERAHPTLLLEGGHLRIAWQCVLGESAWFVKQRCVSAWIDE